MFPLASIEKEKVSSLCCVVVILMDCGIVFCVEEISTERDRRILGYYVEFWKEREDWI